MKLRTFSISLLCATISTITRTMDQNAAINQADSLGRTPLHVLAYTPNFADEQQRIEIMKKLILRGASINAQDKNGLTPLHFSITHKQPATVVNALHTLGADTRLGNAEQKTPLFLACEHGCVEQIEALLSHIPELQPQPATAAPATPAALVATAEITATPIVPAETTPANN